LLETVMTARNILPAHAAPILLQAWQVVAVVNTVVWTLTLAALWTAFDTLIARWKRWGRLSARHSPGLPFRDGHSPGPSPSG
jgi:hypothetical protein